MLDRITDGVFVFDREWRFRYINEPAARMLGRTRAELEGAHAWTEFPEAIDGPSYTVYHRARSEGTHQRVTEFFEPLKTLFEVRVYPVEDELVVLFRDITEQHRTSERLKEYAERMAEAEQIARFGAWRWDIADGVVRWSDELHRIYGIEPGQFGGTAEAFTDFVHPDDRDRVWGHVSRAMETGAPFAFEERIVRPDGSVRHLLSQGKVIRGRTGEASALVGVCHDITDRVQTQHALGMSERRMRAIVDYSPSVVAVKDLEGRYLMANGEAGRIIGKTPDELIGHHCSELYPKHVSEQISANDRLALTSGEPVFDETTMVVDGEQRTYVTVTFALPDDEGRPVEVCTIGTDVTERRERDSERRERMAWQERISTALADGTMLVFAQPVLDLETEEIASSELLVRMSSDDGIIEPAAFLPAAERFGLIQSIDVWMTGQAVGLAAERQLEVNLSAITLCDADALAEIVRLLEAAPAAAANIVFEITETAALEHIAAAQWFAEAITPLGCGLALDDFGTGFGSFTYLRELPLRYLKIDRSFVSRLTESVDDRRVVQSIIGIAAQFGLETIAEGVEDEPTLDLLRVAGADYVQGYHVGRPAPLTTSVGSGNEPLHPPGSG
jgi:PAS domain S-box-containing protein